MLFGPIARILIRYLVGALVMYGLLDAPGADQISNDPDIIALVAMVLATVAGTATELAYALARRWGWRT